MSKLCQLLHCLKESDKNLLKRTEVLMLLRSLILMLIVSCSSFAGGGGHTALETADFVDVKKYLGTWYEIEKIPNSFQRKCGATKANYSLKKNGKIRVTNTCIKKNGKVNVAKGTATVANKTTNAVLEVSFFFLQRWFGGPNYYIIDLADDYSYVLVGSPSRDFLWILSRTPVLDENIITNLKAVATRNGFDVERMTKTPQWQL
jgi:apolipoprotein D and lipocalin family protein